MADTIDVQSGNDLAAAIVAALGMGDPRLYTRVVLVLDCHKPPMVYATKVVDADSVLRVIETLRGVEVLAKDDDTVEIVPPTVTG